MNSVKTTIKRKFRRLYYVYRELRKLQEDRKQLWDEAVAKFNNDHSEHGSLANYKRALYRHRISYDEYNCYRLWELDEERRDEFVSEREMRCIYRKMVQLKFDGYCCNKVLLYKLFSKYVHRKWHFSGALSLEEFREFVASTDCIAKPAKGSLGRGVFVIHKDEDHDWQKLYDQCREDNIIVEERLRACSEIEELHPQSLNTLRVLTISKGGRCELVAAELRIGVGDSVIDNVSAGGVFAPVDLATGMIVGDGSDNAGHQYVVHPDTGKAFKGVVIPHWNEVVAMCKVMTTVVPEMVFAGWDICVLKNGEVEMIEVNSYPNVTGLQTAYHKGLRPQISAIGKDVLGFDPVKLVSVWSKSFVKYENIYGKY